jgi:hypothetical protein
MGSNQNEEGRVSTFVYHSTVLPPWSWAILEKPPVVQLLKNFPTFYGTRWFITVFTGALQWSLSSDRSMQSIPPNPTSLRYILILKNAVF